MVKEVVSNALIARIVSHLSLEAATAKQANATQLSEKSIMCAILTAQKATSTLLELALSVMDAFPASAPQVPRVSLQYVAWTQK